MPDFPSQLTHMLINGHNDIIFGFKLKVKLNCCKSKFLPTTDLGDLWMARTFMSLEKRMDVISPWSSSLQVNTLITITRSQHFLHIFLSYKYNLKLGIASLKTGKTEQINRLPNHCSTQVVTNKNFESLVTDHSHMLTCTKHTEAKPFSDYPFLTDLLTHLGVSVCTPTFTSTKP
jgi:hypothetical protein